MEILHSFLIISLYFLKILSIISQKLSKISQKTLYNLSKCSLHILSCNLSLYSHSIIKIILTHDHLGMNFTFVLVFNKLRSIWSVMIFLTFSVRLFLNPNYFSDSSSDCFHVLDLGDFQEQVINAFCFKNCTYL